MIKLSRAELREIIRSFMVANTPKSLFKSLYATTAVQRLRTQVEMAALASAYDSTTGRANRSPLTMALAYAYLIAYITSPKNQQIAPIDFDPTRLSWGVEVKRYASTPISASSNVTVEVTSAVPGQMKIFTGSSVAGEKRKFPPQTFSLDNS